MPLGTDTSTLEEYSWSAFGEKVQRRSPVEKRGEAKRKAQDGGADSKKARAEIEYRGVKRYSDNLDQSAKGLREGIVKRAAERSNSGTGMDVSTAEVMAVLTEKKET